MGSCKTQATRLAATWTAQPPGLAGSSACWRRHPPAVSAQRHHVRRWVKQTPKLLHARPVHRGGGCALPCRRKMGRSRLAEVAARWRLWLPPLVAAGRQNVHDRWIRGSELLPELGCLANRV